jgi:hypothetical protein
MQEEYTNTASPEQQYFTDINTRLRDIEEKQRLLKDRTLLIGKNLVEERSSLFEDMQDLKKQVILLKEQNLRMQEILKRLTGHLSETARKEELLILQRQFDLFRK